jgi:hypothetical protein
MPSPEGPNLKQCRAESFSREATSLSKPKGEAKASHASLGATLGCKAQRIFVLCLLVQVPKGIVKHVGYRVAATFLGYWPQ